MFWPLNLGLKSAKSLLGGRFGYFYFIFALGGSVLIEVQGGEGGEGPGEGVLGGGAELISGLRHPTRLDLGYNPLDMDESTEN